jgi:hypothetical protein
MRMAAENFSQKLILGVLTLIIAPLAIFYFEQKWSAKSDHANQPPQTKIISVNGQVVDENAKGLLQNVDVRIHVSTFNEDQKTDSLGRYAFSLENFNPELAGSMSVEAAGYKPLTYNLSLQAMSELHDITLVAAGPPPVSGGVVINHSLATRYVPRLDVKKLSALAHH